MGGGKFKSRNGTARRFHDRVGGILLFLIIVIIIVVVAFSPASAERGKGRGRSRSRNPRASWTRDRRTIEPHRAATRGAPGFQSAWSGGRKIGEHYLPPAEGYGTDGPRTRNTENSELGH
jgi:hypothetical protein